jgi:putative selenoprotein
MRRAWNGARRGAARLWLGLREWCGDAAYEKYRSCAMRTGQREVLSPERFYVEQLNKKYSSPSRCC